MTEELHNKFNKILAKDFTKLTTEEAQKLFEQDVINEIHNLAKVCRGMTRILMLEPCNWDTDLRQWTEEDKDYAKKLLKFLLTTNGFQNIEA